MADYYNDTLDADSQINSEERIAVHLFDNYREGLNEQEAADAGRTILKMVLSEFRYDVFNSGG